MKPANKIYLNLVFFSCVLAALHLSSCKKYIDVPAPKMSLEADKVFSDSAATLSSVLQLYDREVMELLNIYPSLSADEVIMPPASIWNSFFNAANMQGNTLSVIADGALNGFSVGARIYQPLYQKINTANLCIAGISSSNAYGVANKNQLIGECKFWRAWSYFYLLNLFGNVPLNLSPVLETNKTLSNAPTAEIYKQIIEDLTDARNRLSATNMSTEKIRVNKAAVTAMLARVYFFQQNWPAAYSEASTLLTSTTYTLESDLATVFLKTSKETIFQIQTVNSGATALTGVTQIPGFFAPLSGVLLTSYANANLLSSFQTGDLRKSKWIANFLDFNTFQSYSYPSKYKLNNASVSGNEYIVMFRLAELYLIRAEAAANLDRLAEAEEDLFTVRKRAGLSTRLALPDLPTALTALERERRLELFTEYGDRWLNLKRTGRIHTVLPVTKVGTVPGYKWEPYQALYPIPSQEVFANRNLKQNPGY